MWLIASQNKNKIDANRQFSHLSCVSGLPQEMNTVIVMQIVNVDLFRVDEKVIKNSTSLFLNSMQMSINTKKDATQWDDAIFSRFGTFHTCPLRFNHCDLKFFNDWTSAQKVFDN